MRRPRRAPRRGRPPPPGRRAAAASAARCAPRPRPVPGPGQGSPRGGRAGSLLQAPGASPAGRHRAALPSVDRQVRRLTAHRTAAGLGVSRDHMTRSLSSILLTAVLLAVLPAAARAAPSATGDFDGDGESDLAVGAPLDSVAGRENAGAVNVIYGSSRRGLREDPDQQFTQGTRGIQGWVDADDRFGAALAAGD